MNKEILQSLTAVVDYLLTDEEKHWEESGRPESHIYADALRLQTFIKTVPLTDSMLTKKDLEIIDRMIYKNADDIAISISRSLERLEERIDRCETRLHGHLTDEIDRLGQDIRETKK